MKEKIIRYTMVGSAFAIVLAGSVLIANAAEYATRDNLASKGQFLYTDEATGDQIVLDSNDFVRIADAIDSTKNTIDTKLSSLSAKVAEAETICR